MGRRSLKIERLETAKERQSKFSKRKIGLLKKAKELSALCEVDVGVLMFSPTGKASLYVGQDKELSTILERLSAMTIDERQERRAYTAKMLERAYPESAGSQVDALRIAAEGLAKDLQDELQELRATLETKRRVLSDWKNPENITDLAQIQIMEDHVVARLAQVKERKFQLQQENQS